MFEQGEAFRPSSRRDRGLDRGGPSIRGRRAHDPVHEPAASPARSGCSPERALGPRPGTDRGGGCSEIFDRAALRAIVASDADLSETLCAGHPPAHRLTREEATATPWWCSAHATRPVRSTCSSSSHATGKPYTRSTVEHDPDGAGGARSVRSRGRGRGGRDLPRPRVLKNRAKRELAGLPRCTAALDRHGIRDVVGGRRGSTRALPRRVYGSAEGSTFCDSDSTAPGGQAVRATGSENTRPSRRASGQALARVRYNQAGEFGRDIAISAHRDTPGLWFAGLPHRAGCRTGVGPRRRTSRDSPPAARYQSRARRVERFEGWDLTAQGVRGNAVRTARRSFRRGRRKNRRVRRWCSRAHRAQGPVPRARQGRQDPCRGNIIRRIGKDHAPIERSRRGPRIGASEGVTAIERG